MTMTMIALHEPPRSSEAAREQLRAVGVALRWDALIFLALLLVFLVFNTIHAFRIAGDANHQASVDYGPAGAVPMLLIAFLLPFVVWRGEDPARRAYHWAMPVPRETHTLLKVASGWLWLVFGVGAYLLFITALSWSTSAITGNWPSDRAAAWEWLVPFTAATACYLFASALVVGSRHPWRWVFIALLVWLFGAAYIDSMDLHELGRAAGRIWGGEWGLQAVLIGSPERYIDDAARRLAWMRATSLWGAVGVIALLWAARWRGEA